MSNAPHIVCLMGPTASGKTDVAVELVQQLACEIVSVDSALVYRGMDIGTAKPTPDILKHAPHHLIDIRDPAEPYSAAEFCNDARREIKAIHSRGRIPLLVGGTMLYFRALQQGLSDLPTANAETRAKLLAEAEAEGWHALHDRLSKIDPQAAQRIHPNDTQRLQRALEVYELTGTPMSELFVSSDSHQDYPVVNIIIAPSDRDFLHARIAQRFTTMLDQGFVDEVTMLMARDDLSLDMPSMRAVGYRQVWEYLLGKLSHQEMQERGVIATRQLAKRQLTWLRAWENTHWFDSQDPERIKKIVTLLRVLTP